MKRLVFILIITAMLFGCAFADVSKDITIDMTKEFVPESVMNNIKEGTEISYLIDEENSKLILELTNKDKTQTIERDVKLVYPEYSIIENIRNRVYEIYKQHGGNGRVAKSAEFIQYIDNMLNE